MDHYCISCGARHGELYHEYAERQDEPFIEGSIFPPFFVKEMTLGSLCQYCGAAPHITYNYDKYTGELVNKNSG